MNNRIEILIGLDEASRSIWPKLV